MVRKLIKYSVLFFGCVILFISCDEDKKPDLEVVADSPATAIDTSIVANESDVYNPTTPFEELVATYERPDRSDWQKPIKVIDFLGENLQDKVVAEIGAGSGYFTFRLVPKVEKIIAVDIDPRMLEFIDSCRNIYLPERLQKRLETRLVDPHDPKLKPGEVDVVFLANTYAFIENRINYFSDLKKTIQPGGRLVIVDYKKRKLPVGPDAKYKVPLHEVEAELMKAGYTQVYADDQSLPYQYIVVALLN
jgi:SAM-dependent methyltransferase